EPWEHQDNVLAYLRSGLILAYPMGADLLDWYDRPNKANVVIEGQRVGGATPMTDGGWFWHAGLIHFIEKYHVRVAPEFMAHAAREHWQVHKETIPRLRYDFSYFA